MKLAPFSRLLEGALRRVGVNPDDADAEIKQALIEAIGDRFKFAYDYYPWPVYYPIEQRFFRPVWDAAATYAAGTELYFEGADAYFAANAAPDNPAAGESPETDSDKWTELTSLHRYVAYEQPGLDAIDAVVAAWSADPRIYESALELRWTVGREGFTFAPGTAGTSVWLQYRPQAPRFAAQIYAAGAHAEDDCVYFPDLGEVYVANEATSAGQTPTTHPAKWTLQEFPEFLELAVKAGAIADYLTGDEQPNAASRWEARFIELLDEQVWQLTKLQGQTGRIKINPH